MFAGRFYWGKSAILFAVYAGGSSQVGLIRSGVYNEVMERQPEQIFDIALALPENARANLAASLIRSLDATPDPSADAAWAVEIERRIRDIDKCAVELDSWDDVMDSMRDRRNG